MKADDAVTAGRGFLFIAGAKVYFMVCSALLALGLPRLLGDPALFGRYRVVNSLISILNMVMIVGTIQTVSKLISEDESRTRQVRNTALKLQFVIGGVLWLILMVGAESICHFLFRDVTLANYLRVGGTVTYCYAIYAIFVGVFNGTKSFATQAKVDMVFSTLKVGLIAGLVLAGFGVMGAFIGFVIAAAVITVIGAVVAARLLGNGETPIKTRDLSTLLVPILASTLMVNLIIQLDILGIKGLAYGLVENHFASESGLRRIDWLLAPMGASATPDMVQAFSQEATDRLAGLFGGAKNISLLPYQATFALTFVVFPLVSKATFDNDRERAATTISQSLRFALIIAALLGVSLGAIGEPMLAILLGPSYGSAAAALYILLAATVFLALLVMCVTILNSARMAQEALVISFVTVLAIAVFLYLSLKTTPDLREGLLVRASIGTIAAVGLGLSASMYLINKRLGATISPATWLKIIVVSLLVSVVAYFWQTSSLVTMLIKGAAIALFFLAGLVLTKELNDSDLNAIMRILGRKT